LSPKVKTAIRRDFIIQDMTHFRTILIGGIAAAAVTLSACASTTKTGASTGVAAEDVAAAHACHVMQEFLKQNASGQDVIDASSPLMAGIEEAQAHGRPSPKWSDLGANLILTAGDVNSGDMTQATSDGNKVADECHTIPANARAAGGYV
jgi:hypothetical protein